MTKSWRRKKYSRKFFNLFMIKNCNFLMSKTPTYRRSLQPSKKNIQQKIKFITFFYMFVGHFGPPGSGPGLRIRIRIQGPHPIRIHDHKMVRTLPGGRRGWQNEWRDGGGAGSCCPVWRGWRRGARRWTWAPASPAPRAHRTRAGSARTQPGPPDQTQEHVTKRVDPDLDIFSWEEMDG